MGLLSLVSFFYRYGYVFPRQGNLGFEGNRLDWFTMALHTALSTSSLIVSKKSLYSQLSRHRSPCRVGPVQIGPVGAATAI